MAIWTGKCHQSLHTEKVVSSKLVQFQFRLTDPFKVNCRILVLDLSIWFLLVKFGPNVPFIQKGNGFYLFFFIPKICRISRSHSFQCCLPYCFKGVISICMIATVHKSLVLTGFLQHDVEKNFCKKRGEIAIVKGCFMIQAVSRDWFFSFFLVKCFHANFSFLPQGKGYYNQHFLLSLCVGGKKAHTSDIS